MLPVPGREKPPGERQSRWGRGEYITSVQRGFWVEVTYISEKLTLRLKHCSFHLLGTWYWTSTCGLAHSLL